MLRALRELAVGFRGAPVRVLCYHAGCDRDRFATQMSIVADAGYTVLSLAEFRAWLAHGAGIRAPAVVITFDGYVRDDLRPVLPVLDALRFPAVFFPISLHLDPSTGAVLDGHDLRALISAGHAIGSHAHTHPRLTRLSDAAVVADLTTSKTLVEDAIGAPVTAFSYPYGDHDARVRRIVERVGFDLAFTVDLGGVHRRDDAYALGRACVIGNPGARAFKTFVDGGRLRSGPVLLGWKILERMKP